MVRFLRLFHAKSAEPSRSEILYDQAMAETTDIVSQIRKLTASDHPVCRIIHDLWKHRKNTPVLTTLYESHQEMMTAVAHDPMRK